MNGVRRRRVERIISSDISRVVLLSMSPEIKYSSKVVDFEVQNESGEMKHKTEKLT